ncbi:MAG: spermidine synthase [Dehalococcoidia bacterium]|nr:spermidine synthase [Dehalococcoidia bacterium]
MGRDAGGTAPAVLRRGWSAHLPTILLASCMFFTGAAGLVSEYILSTVSTYILGNSIEQFSVIIALMLLMMGLAGYLQRYLSDRHLLDKFILVESSLALLAGFAPLAIYASFGYLNSHFRLIQYFFVISIGLLIGFEIPLVLRINQRYVKNLGANLASTYAFDYVGSFVGALVWTYVLLRTFPITEISFIIAGVNFAIAAVTFAYFLSRGLITYRRLTLAAVLVTVAALVYGYAQNRDWSQLLEQRFYRDPVVFSELTRYQQLALTHSSSANDYRFFINGNLQFSSVDEAIYHEHLVHPVMSLVPDRRRVLVLGGGDGLALRELLKYPRVETVTLVDIDPAIIRVATTHPVLNMLNEDAFADARVSAQPSPGVTASGERAILQQVPKRGYAGGDVPLEPVGRVEVFTVDADRFLGEVGGAWNAVVIDLPDPSSIELSKLYSREFYGKVRRVLTPGGMVALQATSPYHAKESFLAINRTLQAAGFQTLPYHDNVPSFGDWGWILAWYDAPETEIRGKLASLRSFSVPTRYLTPEVVRQALVFGKGRLETERTDISTLMYPRLLDYYRYESWRGERRAP